MEHCLYYLFCILSVWLLLYIMLELKIFRDRKKLVIDNFKLLNKNFSKRIELVWKIINIAKQFARLECEALEKNIKVDNDGYDELSINDKIFLNEELDKSMKKIYLISSAYPEVLNNAKYVKFEKELIRCDKRINKGKKKYNNAVKIYEDRKKIFPTNFIAWIFRDVKYKYYDLSDKE